MGIIRLFDIRQPRRGGLGSADLIALVALGVLLYGGVRLAHYAPRRILGPEITLAHGALPWYASLSLGRMAAAYLLSILFTFACGSLAAGSRTAERLLLPALDVLQSVPILSFLPVVLLSFSALLPQGIAAELASIVLIFTSQVWNLTFAWYQSLTTIPTELREASAIFRFGGWMRFRVLELPFAAITLLWNSMMSWAGGWFFLMAAEIFTVGERDFRLPGLGSYLKEAARLGDLSAVVWGLGTLVLLITVLDQLIWRPLVAWADRFKLESVSGEAPASSWALQAAKRSMVVDWLRTRVTRPAMERLDAAFNHPRPAEERAAASGARRKWSLRLLAGGAVGALIYGSIRATMLLSLVPSTEWASLAPALLATLGRVLASLVLAALWTVPVGVWIGSRPRVAAALQPVVQVAASVPATALFPVLISVLLRIPGGLSTAAIGLMLLGTQWYLLFNVIAGTTAIPRDLQYTTALLQFGPVDRWRVLLLPALLPYLVTGALTAAGGAWNASIVAEYVEFGGHSVHTVGIGARIAEATAAGDYPLLLAATLAMVLTVVAFNRLLWRRLYRVAEARFRIE
jgi:NitT/TauT family transport system permease protein